MELEASVITKKKKQTKNLFVKTKEKQSLCPHLLSSTISLRYIYYFYLYLCEQRGWHLFLAMLMLFSPQEMFLYEHDFKSC